MPKTGVHLYGALYPPVHQSAVYIQKETISEIQCGTYLYHIIISNIPFT